MKRSSLFIFEICTPMYLFVLIFFAKIMYPFFNCFSLIFWVEAKLHSASWFLKSSVFLRILATFDWSDFCQFQKWFKPITRQSTTSKTLLMHWRVGNTSKFGEASKENMALLVAIWIIIVPPFRIQKKFQLLRAEEHEVSSNIFLSRPKVVSFNLKSLKFDCTMTELIIKPLKHKSVVGQVCIYHEHMQP